VNRGDLMQSKAPENRQSLLQVERTELAPE